MADPTQPEQQKVKIFDQNPSLVDVLCYEMPGGVLPLKWEIVARLSRMLVCELDC